MFADSLYRLDLDGFVVLPRALESDLVARLNESIDAHVSEPGESLASQRFAGFLGWDDGFRGLLDHDSVLPLLVELLDESLRLDRYYGIHMRAGTSGLPLHGGAMDVDGESEFYGVLSGRIRSGIVTVIWALTDATEADGGFMAIPGSHKSFLPRPGHLDHTSPEARPVPMRAGDVLVFTGALSHGTIPWTASHARRALVFKYAPQHIAWSPSYLDWPAEHLELFTPRQRRLFDPPYVYGREPVVTGRNEGMKYVDPAATLTR